MSIGRLYLIPIAISESSGPVLPESTLSTLPNIRHFIVENSRTARRFLSSLKIYDSIEALDFVVIDPQQDDATIRGLLDCAKTGHDIGILSESGCPGIADPGAEVVRVAHLMGIEVVPLVGPSSILLALMASGMNGQQFTFHGYLPVKGPDLVKRIETLEAESIKKNQTQIFIETPYRNNSLFTALLKSLSPSTRLCIAIDLTGKGQRIINKTIAEWANAESTWPKVPAIFLFLARKK